MTYQSKFKAWEEGRCVKFSHFVRHAITQRYHRSNMCCIQTHSVVTYVSADSQDFSIPWALYDSCIFWSKLYFYMCHMIKTYQKLILKLIAANALTNILYNFISIMSNLLRRKLLQLTKNRNTIVGWDIFTGHIYALSHHRRLLIHLTCIPS